ncbi:MAG: hypothetical protein ACFFCV_04870 [Promethearchaeota archaeon]
MDLIIFLKDGSERKTPIDRLLASGISGNNFFIESRKNGRLDIPLDSIDGFKLEAKRTYILYETEQSHLTTAIAILSKHLL